MKYYFISEKLGAQKASSDLESDIRKRRISGPHIDLALATIKSIEGDKKSALELIDLALTKDRDNKWCLYEKYQLMKDNPEAAKETFKKLLQIAPEFPRTKIERAYTLRPESNCSEIISLLGKLPASIRYADSESYLGDAYYFCDNPDEAERAYNNSVKLTPTASALAGLGNVQLYVHNNFEAAKSYFQRAVELDKNYQPAITGLAWSLFESGDVVNAESNFIKAYNIDKNEAALQDLILFHLKKKDYKKAVTYINEYRLNFGSNYISEGYALVVDLANSPEQKRNEKIDAYNQKYRQDGIDFTTQLFRELRDN
jgi:Flp pilus assembly protein TadD